jgi:low affinity Fe/Cu permease
MEGSVSWLARLTALVVGSARAFIIAGVLLVGVIATGAANGYSDHWLATFSAFLSAVTFLLVLLLQYRENRDTVAIQLKLNELLRVVEGAHVEELVDVEHLPENEQKDVSRKLQARVPPA